MEKAAEHRRRAEIAAAREAMLEQYSEQERLRLAAKEIGRRRAAKARDLLLQQLAEQQKSKQAAEKIAKRKANENNAAKDLMLQY